jgi:cell division protein ZapE
MSATELTPSQRYAEGVARGDWQNDPAQHAALAELDRIHLGLLDSAEDGWLDRLSSFWKKPEPVKGLYFWGGVGRGKTFLVDLFYDGLPIKQKYRTHFHRFMRSVHERLREHQGRATRWRRSPRNGAATCACWCWTSSSSPTSAMRCCWRGCWSACSPRA